MLQGMAVVGGLSYPRSVQRGACAKGAGGLVRCFPMCLTRVCLSFVCGGSATRVRHTTMSQFVQCGR